MSMTSGPSARLGVDVGGTFTDLLALDRERGVFRVARCLRRLSKESLVEFTSFLNRQRRRLIEERHLFDFDGPVVLNTDEIEPSCERGIAPRFTRIRRRAR